MGFICWIVASGSSWLAVTSAPAVTADRPMRPVMGATTCRIGQVDARGLGRRLGRRDVGFVRLQRGQGVVIGLLADELDRDQFLVALDIAARGLHARFGLRDRSARTVVGRLVGRRVEPVQCRARLHFSAFAVGARLDDTGYLRAHLGNHGGRSAAWQDGLDRNALRFHGQHSDLWRRPFSRRRLCAGRRRRSARRRRSGSSRTRSCEAWLMLTGQGEGTDPKGLMPETLE